MTQRTVAHGARFEELYLRHRGRIMSYALRRVATRPDAEDVVMETFAVAWRRFSTVPAGDEALLWLYRVAAGLVANHNRGERRRVRLLARAAREPVVIPARPSDDHLDLALALLRREDRELLRLTAWEGLTPAELAVVLDCSPNAAAIRLHRARKKLAEAYEKVTEQRAGEVR